MVSEIFMVFESMSTGMMWRPLLKTSLAPVHLNLLIGE